MEFIRLNWQDSNFTPHKIIEGWSSLVWTERYLHPGEFELKTPYIDEVMSILKTGALVSLMDSREIMQVETVSIGYDQEGVPEATVSGKTLDHYFKWRQATATSYGKKWKMARQYDLVDAAAVLMWDAFVNQSGRDVLRAINFSKDQAQWIPSFYITRSTTRGSPVRRRWLAAGQIDVEIYKFLGRRNFGVRTIRPMGLPYAFGSPFYNVTTENGNKGIISMDNTQWYTGSAVFDIYNGVDRSINQSDRDPIVFHHRADQLKDISYLFSVVDYYNRGWIVSSVGTTGVTAPEGYGQGLAFRNVYIDGGSPGPDESNAEFLADLPDMGEDELAKHKAIKLLDAEVAEESGYRYGFAHWFEGYYDYGLGDFVTLKGDYEIDQTMRVVEFTRTQDSAGERGFPGLEEIKEGEVA